jgi:hypothetical protein
LFYDLETCKFIQYFEPTSKNKIIMDIRQFIENNGIKQADVIIVKREKLGLFDHYVIFLGYERETGEPIFIANYSDGVKILPTFQLLQFLETYKPVSIRKFRGAEQERQYAIDRAIQDLETRSSYAYSLIKNNCEHFANWVQKGVRESDQVKDFGKATTVGGLGLTAVGLATKNNGLVLGGLLIAFLGGIANSLGKE